MENPTFCQGEVVKKTNVYLLLSCLCLPQEEVKRLRAHVEEVIKENERLHDEIAKTRGYSQMDW